MKKGKNKKKNCLRRPRKAVSDGEGREDAGLTDGTDKPSDDAEAVGDPYKTLFISRLVGSRRSRIYLRLTDVQSKNATENDVRRQFEHFGPLERVRVVRDKKGRSRGYAFLVYERERDMKGMWELLITRRC